MKRLSTIAGVFLLFAGASFGAPVFGPPPGTVYGSATAYISQSSNPNIHLNDPVIIYWSDISGSGIPWLSYNGYSITGAGEISVDGQSWSATDLSLTHLPLSQNDPNPGSYSLYGYDGSQGHEWTFLSMYGNAGSLFPNGAYLPDATHSVNWTAASSIGGGLSMFDSSGYWTIKYVVDPSSISITSVFVPVPEPSTGGLLAITLFGGLLYRIRFGRKGKQSEKP